MGCITLKYFSSFFLWSLRSASAADGVVRFLFGSFGGCDVGVGGDGFEGIIALEGEEGVFFLMGFRELFLRRKH